MTVATYPVTARPLSLHDLPATGPTDRPGVVHPLFGSCSTGIPSRDGCRPARPGSLAGMTSPAMVRTDTPATSEASGPTRPGAATAWVEQEAGLGWRLLQEYEYARAAVAALVSGMPVRRRGDLLHVRVDGRWHAMAMIPAAAGSHGGRRHAPESRWVHFDLDLHDWFAFGPHGYRTVPAASGWHAMRWLAQTAS